VTMIDWRTLVLLAGPVLVFFAFNVWWMRQVKDVLKMWHTERSRMQAEFTRETELWRTYLKSTSGVDYAASRYEVLGGNSEAPVVGVAADELRRQHEDAVIGRFSTVEGLGDLLPKQEGEG